MNEEYKIRLANESDVPALIDIYKSALDSPFCTWNINYPGEIEIKEDLESKGLFVLEKESEVIGAFSIIENNELDGLTVWSVKEPIKEISRVVIRKDYQGQHLSELMVQDAIDLIKHINYKAIHILVAKANIPAQKAYLKLGFKKVGETHMFDLDFFAFELSF